MRKYIATDKENMGMIKALCSAHETGVTISELSGTDEYLVMIECSFRTWLSLRKVLPIGKPVLVYRIES